jgi:hypothetical protein
MQKNNDGKWERITSAPDFDEDAFLKEHFPQGSYEEALEHGLVEFSDGKGNWHKVQPPVRVTLNLSPVIKKRAESLDASMGMGYQNVLKAAMLLGIKELESKAAVSRL